MQPIRSRYEVPGAKSARSLKQIEEDHKKVQYLKDFMPMDTIKNRYKRSLGSAGSFVANKNYIAKQAEAIAWALLRWWVNMLLDVSKEEGKRGICLGLFLSPSMPQSWWLKKADYLFASLRSINIYGFSWTDNIAVLHKFSSNVTTWLISEKVRLFLPDSRYIYVDDYGVIYLAKK